jgi:hypothetical protein
MGRGIPDAGDGRKARGPHNIWRRRIRGYLRPALVRK